MNSKNSICRPHTHFEKKYHRKKKSQNRGNLSVWCKGDRRTSVSREKFKRASQREYRLCKKYVAEGAALFQIQTNWGGENNQFFRGREKGLDLRKEYSCLKCVGVFFETRFQFKKAVSNCFSELSIFQVKRWNLPLRTGLPNTRMVRGLTDVLQCVFFRLKGLQTSNHHTMFQYNTS